MAKKLLISITLFSVISFSVPAYAETEEGKYNPMFALTDIIFLRPMGLIATVAGSALFIGLSPVTALASITPPHDAFSHMGHYLVMTPVDFTFSRPIGVNEKAALSVPSSVIENEEEIYCREHQADYRVSNKFQCPDGSDHY